MIQTLQSDSNALRIIEDHFETSGEERGFGAIMARAGVGKTSFLVQIAIAYMMKEKKVLHISLDDPVQKVTLRYEEAFRLMKEHKRNSSAFKNIAWENLIANRFIMTFKEEGFNVPKLEERLTDLTEQNIFIPKVMIIDGLAFDDDGKKILSDLTKLSESHGIPIWFTVTIHRHEEAGPDGMPVQMKNISDLFRLILLLRPDREKIHIEILKQEKDAPQDTGLYLSTSGFLICSQND